MAAWMFVNGVHRSSNNKSLIHGVVRTNILFTCVNGVIRNITNMDQTPKPKIRTYSELVQEK